jgi:hypothetical protein
VGRKNVERLKKDVEALHRKMSEIGPLMRGSIVRIGTKNKQYYFSLNKDKKTKLIYLGDKRVETARVFSDNYKKLLQIIEKVTILNMEILKRTEC